MRAGQGDTLQGVTLRQGLVNVVVANGAKTGINHIYCVVAGNLTLTFVDGSTSVVPCIVGESHPVDCKSVTATTGTFHFSRD